MTSPVASKIWTISPNNQIAFTSLNQVTADVLLKIGGTAGQLATAGVTCKGSCDGTTGAMDGTNRWTNNTKTNTRFSGAGGAQSWIVYTLGNGADVLFTFDGASDDVFKICFSPGGLYLVAGTANQKPVAADECDVNSSNLSMVGATASADRRLHMWIDSTKRHIRYAIYRQNVMIALFGVESFTSTVDGVVTVIANPVWGFLYNNGVINAAGLTGNYSAAAGGLTRGVVSSVAKTLQLGATVEQICGSTTALAAAKPQINGGAGWAAFPLGLGTIADAAAIGKIGNRIDWWQNQNSVSGADGGTSDSKEFFTMGTNGCCMLPWDSATGPINT